LLAWHNRLYSGVQNQAHAPDSTHPFSPTFNFQFLKMSKSCLIIGGGISGITAALSLSKIGIACTIYELRATPATIGGAVNLTPNALRLLEYLDVEGVWMSS
jgi:monoamine oxidase